MVQNVSFYVELNQMVELLQNQFLDHQRDNKDSNTYRLGCVLMTDMQTPNLKKDHLKKVVMNGVECSE